MRARPIRPVAPVMRIVIAPRRSPPARPSSTPPLYPDPPFAARAWPAQACACCQDPAQSHRRARCDLLASEAFFGAGLDDLRGLPRRRGLGLLRGCRLRGGVAWAPACGGRRGRRAARAAASAAVVPLASTVRQSAGSWSSVIGRFSGAGVPGLGGAPAAGRLDQLEPARELRAAAVVVVVDRRLAFAVGAALGAGDADVEVVVVPPIRPDLAQPVAVLLVLGRPRTPPS